MVNMKLFFIFLVEVYLFTTSSFAYAAGSKFSGSQEDVEIMKHLNRLNKPPVKSIKSSDGDIIDCVLISHQPAFDHPFLKNHTIQTTPNYHPNWRNEVSSSKQEVIPQLWHLNGKCPEGTIPIRRTTKEDILRASSIESFGKKNFSTIAQTSSFNPPQRPVGSETHIHSFAEIKGEFYGTRAIFNIWNPRLELSNEFSLGQLWILGGYQSDLNTIEVGWHVNPRLYNDYNTRLFIYSTNDGYQTGCYNLLCAGFVQTNNELLIGGVFSSISQLNGFQAEIRISVWQDPKTRNWWLQLGNGNMLGYWPYTLFSYLSTSASLVQWGGEVLTYATTYHTSTQMGSGQFAEQGYAKSSYIKNIQVVDQSHTWNTPHISAYSEQPTCYDIRTGYDDVWGSYFYYGGPGRNPNCS